MVTRAMAAGAAVCTSNSGWLWLELAAAASACQAENAESGLCVVSPQAQYMPLESQEGANGEAAQPLRAASNGGVGTV